MKVSRKIVKKIVAVIMVSSLLNPLVGSLTVVASEYEALNIDNNIEEHQNKELKDSVEPVIEDEQEESVHIDEENDREDSPAQIQTENKEGDSSETEFENNEEVFSAEDVREKAIQMMETEKNNATTFSIRARSLSKTEAFINAVSSYAINIANEYNLYPSVMIAQAALESAWGTSILAYTPNHNLFGIKGQYNGQYFSKYTKEYDQKKGWITIKADFKKYPSYKEAFVDNAKKLRYGTDWNKTYYNGTWKENTKSYKDSTNWLTGRYATDPTYGQKLNLIIDTYDLTQFDNKEVNGKDDLEKIKNLSYDEIISTTNIKDYNAYINGVTDGIYTAPKGTKNSSVVASSAEYFNKDVVATQESRTKNGSTWIMLYLNGKQLGWIEKNGLSIYDEISSSKVTNYKALISRSGDTLNTSPWGTKGYQTVDRSDNYIGKEVSVLKEAVTRRATWALIRLPNGKQLWIDKAALDVEKIESSKAINYKALISRSGDTLNTAPWGTEGYQTVGKSDKYVGKEVTIVKEAVTRRATWALVDLPDGKQLWIDKKGLNVEKIVSTKDVKYKGILNRAGDTINTVPWGTEGYQTVAKSDDYLGQEVNVLKEAITRRAEWLLISLNGRNLGWIDAKALKVYDSIDFTKNVSYKALISRSGDTLNTEPWGTKDFKTIGRSEQYLNQEVTVLREAVTYRATWALVKLPNDKQVWIDKAALNVEKIESSKSVSYKALFSRSGDTLNTAPWGTEGYKTVGRSDDYLGKEITVIKEAVTRRATWALVKLPNGSQVWVDKKGLDIEKIESSKSTNYKAVFSRSGDTLNTAPWGTEGYKTVGRSDDYLGKEITVIKEAITRRATWALVKLPNGSQVWVDKKGLDIEKIVSTTAVNYKARIVRATDSINTAPWGTEGYKTTDYSNKYFGAEVTVKKEAKTRRATWALIAFNGKELGWIDKAALKKLDPNKKVVVIDAGHGGSDPGAQRVGVREKDLNLSVAKKVQSKLKAAGYEVIMTRTNDTFIALSERARIANISNADIFVSIHTNSFNGITSGIETFSYDLTGNASNPIVANDRNRMLKSNTLSSSIQNSLISNTNAKSRGAKKANFHVLRETGMPAVLTEIGFIDNTTERNKLVTNSYQEKLANGITNGIKEYFRLVK